MASTPVEATLKPLKNLPEPSDTYRMGKTRLSMAFEELSGSFAGTTLARTRSGLAARSKPTYKYPKNAAVGAGNARMRLANAAWNEMSVEQAERWNAHAETITKTEPLSGTRYHPIGKNVLVVYASKLLQIDPDAAIPFEPPAGPFAPPRVRLSVSGSSTGATFVASAALPQAVLVELMIQPLLNGKRSPTKFYKSAAFVSFPKGDLTVTIPLPAGWYACAYQLVEASAGRTKGHRPLGKIEVVSTGPLEPQRGA